MPIAYIGLGSNLGDRQNQLEKALSEMKTAGLLIRQVSSFLQTAPYGVLDQPVFLNAVCEVETALPPDALLELLLAIEQKMGRVRTRHWGPRTIDLDLLLYDRQIIDNPPRLIIPHPDMQNRLFVLRPLAEIAPSLIHPKLNETIARLLNHLQQQLR